MKYIRLVFFLWLLAGLGTFIIPQAAFGHGDSIVVTLNSNKLTTNRPYYADNNETFLLGTTTVPGFDLSGIPTNTVLGLKVTHTLYYWTPANGLAASLAPDYLTITSTNFPSETTDLDQASISNPSSLKLWQTGASQNHHITEFELSDSGDIGAFGLLVQLVDQGGNYTASDPFLIVLNNGLTKAGSGPQPQPLNDGSQFGLAVSDITAQVFPTPEPSSFVLGGIGLVILAAWAVRRPRGR